MARILVTGSAQGVGAEAARQLLGAGHQVVLHGRNPERCDAAMRANPGALGAVEGHFDSLDSTVTFARTLADWGPFDAVIHNAAMGPHQDAPQKTADGLERIFHVNSVSPYVLSCLMPVAPRVIYVGSDAGQYGHVEFEDLNWTRREWSGTQAYADSKLHVAMLAVEMARRFPASRINVVHPGWVRTAMGGPGAAIPVEQGADSLVWLAAADEGAATQSGQFIYKRAVDVINPLALDASLRAKLWEHMERITGWELPAD